MKILGFFAALMLAVAAHGQGTANPGGGGGMNFIAPSPALSPSSASNSFVLINNGAATNLNVNVLTNQGGFFMGGNGTFGTNNSGSTLTVNMPITIVGTNSGNPSLLFTNHTANGVPLLRFAGKNSRPSRGLVISANADFWDILQQDGATLRLGDAQLSTLIQGAGYWQTAAGQTFTVNQATVVIGIAGTAISNVTSVSSSLAWPALTAIGQIATNAIAAPQAVTNRSTVVQQTFPFDAGAVYATEIVSNGFVNVYRIALVSIPVVTNFNRLTIHTY